MATHSAAGAPPGLSPALLATLAQELGLDLDPATCTRLIDYALLLRRWNRVHNLTAIDSNQDLLTHHLLDCLAIVRPLEHALARHVQGYLPHRPLRFLDAGTGGGLPGIVLAIVRPHWHASLVDAVQKKCAFLQQAQVELRLTNVSVHHARLEAARLEPHPLIVSRAFASLADFTRLTRGLLAPGGLWAAMKARATDGEAAELAPDIAPVETITLRVPMLDEQRRLVLLQERPLASAAPSSGAASL